MIYFIQATISGHVKIGYTAGDPAKRLAQLQTGAHEPLELLGAIPGGVAEEQQFHKAFAAYHVRGEWFRGDEAMMTVIRARISPPVVTLERPSACDILNGPSVVCPCCEFEYTRVLSHKTVPGEDNYESGWGGRGDLLVIKFAAECGAEWEQCFGFHKGCTFSFIRITHDCREVDGFSIENAIDESTDLDYLGVPTF